MARKKEREGETQAERKQVCWCVSVSHLSGLYGIPTASWITAQLPGDKLTSDRAGCRAPAPAACAAFHFAARTAGAAAA